MVFGISSNQFEPLVLTTLCQFQKLLFEQSIEQSIRPQLLQSDTSDCRKHPFAQMIPSHYRCRSNRLLAATSSLSTWKLGGLDQGQAAEQTNPRFAAMVFGISSNQFEPLVLTTLCQFQKLLFEQSIGRSFSKVTPLTAGSTLLHKWFLHTTGVDQTVFGSYLFTLNLETWGPGPGPSSRTNESMNETRIHSLKYEVLTLMCLSLCCNGFRYFLKPVWTLGLNYFVPVSKTSFRAIYSAAASPKWHLWLPEAPFCTNDSFTLQV